VLLRPVRHRLLQPRVITGRCRRQHSAHCADIVFTTVRLNELVGAPNLPSLRSLGHFHPQARWIHVRRACPQNPGNSSRRLHIDKAMLRTWREDFARLMREQGIAANATPRAVRGRNKGKTRDAIHRAQQRGASTVVRQRVTDVAKQLVRTGTVRDTARSDLFETRRAVMGAWLQIVDTLDLQGEVVLAGDVREGKSNRVQRAFEVHQQGILW